MKNHRLLTVLSILFLTIFLMSCAKWPLIGQEKAAARDEQKVEKPASPAEVKTPDARAAEVKVPEIKPPEMKAEEVKPQVIPKDVTPPSAIVNRQAIGCILPLSGRFADAGEKALDAILLSADLFDSRFMSPWKIVVADSGETPERMKEAVAYLADQEQVMAIVAISGSSEADEAAREAQKRKVPLILIASKEGVTQAGDYVFQHFLTPTQQMGALARYALDNLNVAMYSILYPEDEYGEEMVRLFRAAVQKTGGKVIRAIPYSKTQTDFTEQINKLTGNKIVKSDKAYATTEQAKARLTVDFEALFIPDSYLRVKMITSQLAFYDVTGIKLLGTSLWHSPELLKKGPEYLEGSIFADSFLANGFLPETNDFVDAYYAAYRREPGNIEALAYDTMDMVIAILEDDEIKTRTDFIAALSALERFRGATGSINFSGSRVAWKNPFILQVRHGKIEQVK